MSDLTATQSEPLELGGVSVRPFTAMFPEDAAFWAYLAWKITTGCTEAGREPVGELVGMHNESGLPWKTFDAWAWYFTTD